MLSYYFENALIFTLMALNQPLGVSYLAARATKAREGIDPAPSE